MTRHSTRRAPSTAWQVALRILHGIGRFLWRSPHAPLALGTATTLILWQRTFWEASIAVGWGTLLGMSLDLARSFFSTASAHPPAPAGSTKDLQTASRPITNQQLAPASCAPPAMFPNAATDARTPPEPTLGVRTQELAEPPPLPTDGLSWLNVAWVAGPICRTPHFTTIAGGGARLAVCVATQGYSDDRLSGDSRVCHEYHWVVLWDELARRYRGQLKKDTEVIAVGSSRTRQWKDKQGRPTRD